MTQELLSKVFDGDCSPEELDRLLAALDRNPQLMSQWGRLCAGADAHKGVRIQSRHGDICNGVMAALLREPAPSAKVVALKPRRTMIWKSMTGLAAAASVAGLMVFGLKSGLTPHDDVASQSPTEMLALAQEPDDSGLASVDSPAQQRWSATSNEGAQQLDSYLVDHSNYRTASGVNDTLGYARFAAHTAEYRP